MTRARAVGIAGAIAWSSVAGAAMPAFHEVEDRPPAVTTTADQPARTPSARLHIDPYGDISEELLLQYIEELTSIRAFSGWRNSASVGEAEAMDWVSEQLERMSFLAGHGLEIERQSFHTYSGTDFRETRVMLRVGGVDAEVPAFGISGHRDYLWRALLFDSDGVVNDDDPDPVEVDGAAVVVRSAAELSSLPSLEGHVVLVDFAVIDRSILPRDTARANANEILNRSPAAVVPVTSFSNTIGESHGSFAGDLPIWTDLDGPLPPILNLRLEDLHVAGVESWADLEDVERVRLTWDMDVHSPGTSQNLVARIPGQDSSHAVIVSAHLDSPNNPGGIDDGSGSVAALQVAHAVNAAHIVPPVDLYLVWYGSHERGLYGSSHFIANHQELLDRTLAMLQMDCLSVPLDSLDMDLYVETWSYGRLGDASIPWPEYVSGSVAAHGVVSYPVNYYGLVSDNTNFTAYDVPNANLIYMDPFRDVEVHYAGHMHDPYDTPDLVHREIGTLTNMARTALVVALETGRDRPQLRVTPVPDRRVVFVASHTESAHMSPTHLVDLSMTLSWEGFDVDLIPYGRPVTATDLTDADLVLALPVHDYPSVDGDIDLYDEAWTADEVEVLDRFVDDGGLLILSNSANRLKYYNYVFEANEDSGDANALASRFGIEYRNGSLPGAMAVVTGSHSLTRGVNRIEMARDNGVPFTAAGGQVLATVSSQPAVALVPSGAGEVLVLADVGMLGNNGGPPTNLAWWRNLARYARDR